MTAPKKASTRGKISKPKDPNKLPPKERIFCAEYIIDFNGARAAREAGYSAKTADKQAWQLLEKPRIHAEIQKNIAERVKRTQITADRVVLELAAIAFSNLDDFAEWGSDGHGDNFIRLRASDELTRDQKGVIKSIKHVRKTGKTNEDTLEIVREDKLSALDKLAKHLGLYRESEDNSQMSGLMQLAQLMAQKRAEREAHRER